ncbi:hypothetical protein ACHAXT_010173 [Thalassiosira profunda]
MSHLSELSVQLRKLQSEKNHQANEIDRLERQVRILSELKGISIADLQDALRAACASEAHGEMRALVGKLQARVDGLELGGGGISGRHRGAIGSEDNVPTQDQFDREAAARARTKLELRIGELEEIEGNLRSELETLYKTISTLTERNTYLETQVLQQKAQLEQWERRWKAKEEEELRKGSVIPMAASPPPGSYNYSEFAATSSGAPAENAILLHNAPQAQIDAEAEQRALAAEQALAGEKQQRSLVQSQLASTQKSYELKREQYEARIQFLEEQLHDLEQQLNSLYAAFGMMQKDSKDERNEKEAWKRTLLESDAARAKEETEREQQQFATNDNITGQGTALKSDRSGRRSLTQMRSPAAVSAPKAAVRPSAHPPICKGSLLLLLNRDGQPLQPNEQPSTPRQKSLSRKLLPSGRRQSASSQFTKQYVVLHGANGLYQLRYGNSYDGPITGVHEFITAGVSSIDHTPRSSNQPFGFEIVINALMADAPTLCCAAESEEDFLNWMGGLTSVIDGTMDGQEASRKTV